MENGATVPYFLMLIALLLAGALPLSAQDAIPVVPGTMLRVNSPVYSGLGTVVHTRPDTIQLVIEGLASPIDIPAASITRLEARRTATALERALRGVAWGVTVGTLLGLPAMALAETGPEDPPKAAFLLTMAAGGGLWGGAIGLAIPQSRWYAVPIAR